MSAPSQWDTAPPTYMPADYSQSMTRQYDYVPLYSETEPRRPTASRTFTSNERPAAWETSPLHTRFNEATRASRRASNLSPETRAEAFSSVTRNTAESASRVTFETAATHLSSRLSYVTAGSRSSHGSRAYRSQNSSAVSYRTAASSDTPGQKKPITNMTDWKLHLLRIGLIPAEHEELNWSGRGQHAEYARDEETAIPLEVGNLIGYSATALVHEVRCRRILLARKTIACNVRLKRKDAITEVQLLQKLRHAHIIRVVGTYVIGTKLAILLYPVAEWNLETFLDTHLDRREGSQILETFGYFGCLANAVEFLHTNSVKHMDIKPQNILIKSRGTHPKYGAEHQIFLADFGIARSYVSAAAAETESRTSFTRMYAAPEVVAQEKRGLSADIFSLGCVFTEVLSYIQDDADIYLACGVEGPRLSTTRDFLYSSSSHTVNSFLSTSGSFSCWVNHGSEKFFKSLGSLRKFLLEMVSPRPGLRPSAQEVAEWLRKASFASRCDCGQGTPPFEVTSNTSQYDDRVPPIWGIHDPRKYEACVSLWGYAAHVTRSDVPDHHFDLFCCDQDEARKTRNPDETARVLAYLDEVSKWRCNPSGLISFEEPTDREDEEPSARKSEQSEDEQPVAEKSED